MTNANRTVVAVTSCLLLTFQAVAQDNASVDNQKNMRLSSVRERRTSVRSRIVYGSIDAAPLSFLISPDMEGFKVAGREGRWEMTEELQGVASVTPTLAFGVEARLNNSTLGFSIGGGMLVNNAFTAPFAMFDARWQFKIGRHAELGPCVGLIFLGELDWAGSADVSFDSTTGGLVGLEFTIGGQRVAFAGSVGYCLLDSMDVETGGSWHASDDTIDLSGVMVNLGARFKL